MMIRMRAVMLLWNGTKQVIRHMVKMKSDGIDAFIVDKRLKRKLVC